VSRRKREREPVVKLQEPRNRLFAAAGIGLPPSHATPDGLDLAAIFSFTGIAAASAEIARICSSSSS
jgi:hypothetical protein